MRLEVTAEGDEFQDLGQLWIRQRLQDAMQVETDVLAALDNSLRILMKHIPFLADQDHQPHPRSMVRKLCRWLLAVRHNYLDAVVYSKAAEIESRAMEQVQILVVSASNLNKTAAGQSPWSDSVSYTHLTLPTNREV